MRFKNELFTTMSTAEIERNTDVIFGENGPKLETTRSILVVNHIINVIAMEIEDNMMDKSDINGHPTGEDDFYLNYLYPSILIFRKLMEGETCWVTFMFKVGVMDFRLFITKLQAFYMNTYRKSVFIYADYINSDIETILTKLSDEQSTVLHS